MRLKAGTLTGFTLVEVASALGIAAFSLVTLLALFPVGLKEGAVSTLETRGAHLAQTVFATLEGGSFRAAPFFGTTLDLADLDESAAPVVLHVKYPASGEVSIAAAGDEPVDPVGVDYRLELRFKKLPGVRTGVSGSQVTLAITAISLPREIIRFQSVIGNL